MAYFSKRGGMWRAQVRKSNPPLSVSASFKTKAEASLWANKVESDWADGKRGVVPDKSVSDLLDEYAREESPNKKGARWERIRIEAIKKEPLGSVRLRDLSSAHIAAWRNRRLKVVSGSTVNREWNLLSAAFSTAVREWRWLPANPMSDVKRPEENKSRDRLITDHEIEAILLALGASGVSGRVAKAFRYALETGMRAGEIASIKPPMISGRVVTLPDSKNGDSREVPQSERAMEILRSVKGDFNLTASQIDSNFRKAKKRAMCPIPTFHDARHNAATRIGREGKITPLQMCKMFGWKDVRHAMIYFNESAEDIAKRLD